MNKAVHIGLSVIAALILAVVILKPSIADSAVLLESRHPGYCEHIMNENSMYVEENAPYLISYVQKAGFGSVSPEDVSFYLHSLKNQHPSIERTTLSFDDDTGIEIFFGGEGNSRYGRVDVNGIVIDENPSVIDLSRPLIDQIYDLSRVEKKYDKRCNRVFTYYYDHDDNLLPIGEAYFHEFLMSLKDKDFIVSIRDDGTRSLSKSIMSDLEELGITSNLLGMYRMSYYAVVSDGKAVEDLSSGILQHSGVIGGKEYQVISAGHNVGNNSSILIDGKEYSLNVRGMNFVVLENDKIIDTVAFDTFLPSMDSIR